MCEHGLFAYNASSCSFDSESSTKDFIVLGIKKLLMMEGERLLLQ